MNRMKVSEDDIVFFPDKQTNKHMQWQSDAPRIEINTQNSRLSTQSKWEGVWGQRGDRKAGRAVPKEAPAGRGQSVCDRRRQSRAQTLRAAKPEPLRAVRRSGSVLVTHAARWPAPTERLFDTFHKAINELCE